MPNIRGLSLRSYIMYEVETLTLNLVRAFAEKQNNECYEYFPMQC